MESTASDMKDGKRYTVLLCTITFVSLINDKLPAQVPFTTLQLPEVAVLAVQTENGEPT